MKHRCEATAIHRASDPYSRCMKSGTLEHEGHWYCTRHHPPTVAAYDKARNERWEKKWAEQDKARAAAQREQALKDRALEWMTKHWPELIEHWRTEP